VRLGHAPRRRAERALVPVSRDVPKVLQTTSVAPSLLAALERWNEAGPSCASWRGEGAPLGGCEVGRRAPVEMKAGSGRVQARPARSMAPLAVAPDH
jgi:hypothetical protein